MSWAACRGTTGSGGAGRWDVHIGVGTAQQLDAMTVTWPCGTKTVLGTVKAGSKLTVTFP